MLVPTRTYLLLLFNCVFKFLLLFLILLNSHHKIVLFYSELSPCESIDPVCEALHKCYGVMGMQRSGPALGLVQLLHLWEELFCSLYFDLYSWVWLPILFIQLRVSPINSFLTARIFELNRIYLGIDILRWNFPC